MAATPVHRSPPSPYERSLLSRLPIELIYETQLFALSEHFPYVCKYLCGVFKQSPPSFRAQYILGRLNQVTTLNRDWNVFTTALLYPICTQETVEALFRLPRFLTYEKSETGDLNTRLPAPDPPKRLFRDLRPRVRRGIPIPWSEEDKPLPFLRYLFDLYYTRRMITGPPRCDAYEGYALAKAVAAGFVPLVKFLLGHRGDPGAKGAIAVMVAIQRKDLRMVRLLIEGDLCDSNGAKRRRVPDRITCTRAMLQRAAKVEAQDIVQYLLAKGVTPDMQTLRLLHLNGYE
ncbi:hypothetical protein BDM02DRAFT_3272109 [Thelephora ganbajun]|uniref:Uncharacterized protein n=1 Tax=Thelephora ganbajun TaxID=370292 RepID=A0ACB6Z5I0_THEGA|nr:hypothetical protein BDM02DRAFT_3272109 [Thelephora ganbajun]